MALSGPLLLLLGQAGSTAILGGIPESSPLSHQAQFSERLVESQDKRACLLRSWLLSRAKHQHLDGEGTDGVGV